MPEFDVDAAQKVCDTDKRFYGSSNTNQTLAAALDEVRRLRAQLQPYLNEADDDRRWNALCELNDLRCLYCDLRYGERQDYGCDYRPAHAYDDKEVARLTAIRALDGEP